MKKLMLWLIGFGAMSSLWAQEGTGNILGKVKDAYTMEPLAGAHVYVKGTSSETTTGDDGTFELKDVPAGAQQLVIEKENYEPNVLGLTVVPGKSMNIGDVLVYPSESDEERNLGLINLTDQDLQTDEESAETVSGILQSGMDAFQRAAAFQFGNARFSMRGLDSRFSTVYFNGIPMNQNYDGRPQWSAWGGLNDVMRAREMYPNITANDYGMGSLLGGVNYNVKASDIRKTTKVSYAMTNRSYRHRVMASYASGMQKNGWAYAFLVSSRYAGEGYFEGTFYDAKSVFAAVEKRLNDKHSLNLTVFTTPNKRGKSSPNTMEVYDMKGYRYNAYWGLQDGKQRNARRKKICSPTAILTHNWQIDLNTSLQTSVAFNRLKMANSRIGYYNANNPDPTYYRYLPSYWLSRENLPEAANAYLDFMQYGQINWDYLYRANMNNTADDGSARYYYYDDVTDDKNFTFNSNFNKRFSDAFTLSAAVNVRKFTSEGYAYMNDLLGAPFFYDKNPYADPGKEDNDLNNPNRKVGEKDKFSYDYIINGLKSSAYVQGQYFSKYLDLYGAFEYGMRTYQREGLYKNPMFDDSYGKGANIYHNEHAFKAGATFKITGRHLITANFMSQSKAPDMKTIYYNSRVSNDVVPGSDQVGMANEKINGFDVSYIYRSPYLKTRITAYFNQVDNSTEIQRFFAEGISMNGVQGIPSNINGNAFFLTQIVTGESRYYEGLEFGAEAQLTPSWKATAAAAIGRHIYANNPDVYVASDIFGATYLGKSYLSGYRVANGPQQAYSIGVEYRSPHYWFAGMNLNYFNQNYISVSPILRTERFYLDPNTNEPYGEIENYRNHEDWDIPAVTGETLSDLLKQEKLASAVHLNFIGGKSWKVDKYYIGLFVLANNLLDDITPTGGFEQSRKASYPELYVDKKINSVPVFGNKYWMSYGRNYFVMLSVRF
ncbi:MAG: TonB-dependent receptor plug domain-containing protein [Chlorobi bacterium]|nr:TonB-dependent receptor plug domain-containing protein [Chlorobiota bacterium]